MQSAEAEDCPTVATRTASRVACTWAQSAHSGSSCQNNQSGGGGGADATKGQWGQGARKLRHMGYLHNAGEASQGAGGWRVPDKSSDYRGPKSLESACVLMICVVQKTHLQEVHALSIFLPLPRVRWGSVCSLLINLLRAQSPIPSSLNRGLHKLCERLLRPRRRCLCMFYGVLLVTDEFAFVRAYVLVTDLCRECLRIPGPHSHTHSLTRLSFA